MKKIIIIMMFWALLFVLFLNFVNSQETCSFERGSTLNKIFTCNSPNGCFVWIKELKCDNWINGNYNCKSFYYITKNGEMNTNFIEYSKSSVGYYGLNEGNAISLSKGENIKLNFDGTIQYKIKVCNVCECVIDKCENEKIRECYNINYQTGCGVLSNAMSCSNQGEVCISEFGECEIPFKIFLDLGKVIGASKDTFLPSEEISARVRVDSYLTIAKTLVLSIYRETELISKKEIPIALPMGSDEYKYADFTKLALGNYKMVVQIKGTDYKAERTFAVSDNLCVRANFLDKTRFITNKDIGLVIETLDSSCREAISIPNYKSNILVSAMLNGKNVDFSTYELKAGSYQYNLNLKETGLLKIDFTIKREFYPEVKTGKVQYIEQPELNVLPTFKEFTDIGVHNITWKVFDESGERISDSSLNVEIIQSLGSKEIISGNDIKNDGDIYYIEYYFEKGTYKVTILANKDGYSSDSSITLVDIVEEGIEKNSNENIKLILAILIPASLLSLMIYFLRRKK